MGTELRMSHWFWSEVGRVEVMWRSLSKVGVQDSM